MADRKKNATGDISSQLSADLKHPILTREEERRLLRKAKRGDRAARDSALAANLRFILSLARKYRGPLELEDAFQEGAIGELKGISRFDPERGLRLSTYATWWVRQSIQRAGQDTGRTIRIPVNVLDKLRDILRHLAEIERKEGRELSDEELAARTELPLERIKDVRTAARLLSVASLDEPVAEGGQTLFDLVADSAMGAEATEMAVDAQERRIALSQAMRRLSAIEAEVIRQRFVLEQTLTETAKAVAKIHAGKVLSRERIRQIEANAVSKLRKALANSGLVD